MSYDTKCKALAEHFLSDNHGFTPADVHNLAQDIQDAVEGWFTVNPPRVSLNFAKAVREHGDGWLKHGFDWDGRSYSGISPATICAMSDARGPEFGDFMHMKLCGTYGGSFQADGWKAKQRDGDNRE